MGSHLKDYPEITFVNTTPVEIQTIDNWLEQLNADRKKYNFLNLDIQGYELFALQGCVEQLHYADYVYVEVNKKEVYKKCAKMVEIDLILAHYGLKRVATRMTKSGWGDAFYAKNNHFFLTSHFKLTQLIQVFKRISLWPEKLIIKTKKFFVTTRAS